jgi:hypothetical protein
MGLLQAMTEVQVADDTGQSYGLKPAGVRTSQRSADEYSVTWDGEVAAEPGPRGSLRWLEFRAAGSDGPVRVEFPPPAQVPVGTTDPAWPTPAEGYLTALACIGHTSIDGAELGPEGTAHIVATVADALLAVGALPVDSVLLREPSDGGKRAWQRALVHRWGRRAHERVRAAPGGGQQLGLAVRLPLEHATAVIEGISVGEDLVTVRLYGYPWVRGEYWPMITPCFKVRAVDEKGVVHEGVPGDWRGSPSRQGSGGFWLWPPIGTSIRRLRVEVSTLWEAAWAQVELPGR